MYLYSPYLLFFNIILQPIGSMVLVYMLTWLGYIDGIHVTIYSSTMDPSWAIISYMEHICFFFFEWPSKPEAFWVSGVSGVSRGLQQKSAGRADFHLSEQCRYGCLDAGPSAGVLVGLVGYGEWDSHRIGHVQYSTIPLKLCMFISDIGYLSVCYEKNCLFIDIQWYS